jgi:hypothetical protein
VVTDWLMAFDIDVNMRCDHERLWTVIDHDAALPDEGDRVVVACLEQENKGYGFAAVVRVHAVSQLPSDDPTDPARWMVEFDWTESHTCHPSEPQRNFVVQL